MKPGLSLLRVLLPFIAGILAIGYFVPVSAGARGSAPGRGRGGTSTGTSEDGCHHKLGATTKHKHQPFLLYSGHFAGQPKSFNLNVVIDRCKKSPKVASFQANVPGYSCNNGLSAAPAAIDWDGYDSRQEQQTHNGTFNFTVNVNEAGTSTRPPFGLSGTLSGNVRIPKHGPGSGSSQINGQMRPPYCPDLPPLRFSIKFKRTYSYIIRGSAD